MASCCKNSNEPSGSKQCGTNDFLSRTSYVNVVSNNCYTLLSVQLVIINSPMSCKKIPFFLSCVKPHVPISARKLNHKPLRAKTLLILQIR